MKEIRLRDIPLDKRFTVLDLIWQYEREYMPDREPGIRNCVIFALEAGDTYFIYHTASTIVCRQVVHKLTLRSRR